MSQLTWLERFSQLPEWKWVDTLNIRASFWYNPSNDYSMRLTDPGFKFLSHTLGVSSYPFKLSKILLSKQLLQLEKCIQFPYYIQHAKKLVVFDENTIIMLQMYGNLENFLNNTEQHG